MLAVHEAFKALHKLTLPRAVERRKMNVDPAAVIAGILIGRE